MKKPQAASAATYARRRHKAWDEELRRYGAHIVFSRSYNGHPLPPVSHGPHLSEAAVPDLPEDCA